MTDFAIDSAGFLAGYTRHKRPLENPVSTSSLLSYLDIITLIML